MATTKSRKRLLESLSKQSTVEAIIYLPKEEEISEWEHVADQTRYISDSESITPEVQPVSDSSVEAKWLATRIKKILVTQAIDPHEIAVISRSPEKDSSQISKELEFSGIPITTRTQIPMLECGVVSAFLDIYKAASKGWTYKVLKNVLINPYTKTEIDPDLIDRLPMKRGFVGLAEWETGIQNHEFKPKEIDLLDKFRDFTNLMEPFCKFLHPDRSVGK